MLKQHINTSEVKISVCVGGKPKEIIHTYYRETKQHHHQNMVDRMRGTKQISNWVVKEDMRETREAIGWKLINSMFNSPITSLHLRGNFQVPMKPTKSNVIWLLPASPCSPSVLEFAKCTPWPQLLLGALFPRNLHVTSLFHSNKGHS